ncbi:MAG: hypothetical protein JST89_09270 [Cyanobacteria bacterium SZAS-4]|nr:hypothetical protein [Cyanobacteria bacterium SZAS-4]
MSSLLLVTLFTIACVLFPPSATAQNQTRNVRNQIAFKAPGSSQNTQQYSQQYTAYPVTTEGANMPGASSAWNNPGYSNESFDPSNGVTPTNYNISRDTWTPEQSGVASAYNNSNYSADRAAQAGAASGFDRVYDTYAMSAADVLKARSAVLSGKFFSYHGTQSSQASRNR